MIDDPLLTELARYLESQIPGPPAPPGAAAAPAGPVESAPPPLALAARLFERQRALNPAAARFLAGARVPPATLRTPADLPAIPIVAFKEMELTTVPAAERVAEFHSSGTTGQRFSRHLHSAATLQIYRLSIVAWFQRRMLAPRGGADAGGPPLFVSLTPSPADAPHSSLAFMMGTIFERFGSADSCFTGRADPDGWRIDWPATRAALRVAEGSRRPVIVCGTAFNFVHLLDALGEREEAIALPPGSQVMETGGYKGRSRAVPREELHALIAARLGVARGRIASEYGMCELSSQAYDVGEVTPGEYRGNATGAASRRFQFPPWCTALVISPETGRPVSAGSPGLLRVIDLANVASVLAVQTEDLAVAHADGFELLGRATGAEARGCSLLGIAS